MYCPLLFATNINSLTRIVSMTRDYLNRISSVTYPSGNAVGYTYAQGRATNITLNGNAHISAIQYFPLGGPESWLHSSDIATVLHRTQPAARTLTVND